MRRILYLAPRVGPLDGAAPSGAATHVALVLEALRQSFDVLPLLGEAAPAGAAPTAYAPPPGRVRGVLQDVRLVVDDRRNLARALAEARAFGPDLVYERNEYLALTGARVARRLGIPHVLEVNGVLELDMRAFYRSLGEGLGRRVERLKYRRARALVTTSPTLAAELVARGASTTRTHVVPNAVTHDLLLPESPPRPPGGEVVVGWIGHGLSWHGLGLLAGAAERLRDEPSVVFRIVGGGPAVDELKRRVEGTDVQARFEFTGRIPRAELPSALGAFDVGVVPSNPADRFPIKLVEMGAVGVAVAAPPVPCITDFLRPGVDFEPFREGDVDELTRALRALVADGERRQMLRRSLRERVRAEFTVDVVAARLSEIVHGLQSSR